MNAPSFHLDLLPILLLALLLLILTGTTLGWVAAARIRQSDGALYGLGLAAFAGLLFPVLLFVALPLGASLIILRFGTGSPSLTEGDAMILGSVIFASLVLVDFKAIQACVRKILGKGGFRDTLHPRRNRFVIAAITLLWILFGVGLFLQRPRPMGDSLISTSPDGAFNVEASTWQRRRLIGADELCYRFTIRDRDGGRCRCWEIPVMSLAANSEGAKLAAHLIGESGTIHWKEDNREVVFKMNDSEVFSIATDHCLLMSIGGSESAAP